MKSNKRSIKVAILIFLGVLLLPTILKLIAMNTVEIKEGGYAVSLGIVYYRKHNTSSPTSAVRLIRVGFVGSKHFSDPGCIKDNDNLVCGVIPLYR